MGLLGLAAFSLVGCSTMNPSSNDSHSAEHSNITVMPVSEVKWEQLNPARGDASPQAGTLWGSRKAAKSPESEYNDSCPICGLGDRVGEVPTGFLVKFVNGFSSPPHIHNVTYRAAVIDGLIHNDDPDAVPMWMPLGSFWTQPKGEVHITSAKGKVNMALVEIDKSPYLVLPPEEAFDSGERPINMDASNVVWVTPRGLEASSKSPKVAHLWGKMETKSKWNGTFIKLPAGFKGSIVTGSDSFRAVLITGHVQYLGSHSKRLDPGSYFGSKGNASHPLSNRSFGESIIYVRAKGGYTIKATR